MAATIRITSYPWQPDSTKTALRAIGDLGVGLMRDLKTQRGIHTETLMTVLGALAGFAAQRELNERERSRDERRLLTEIKFHTMRILPIRLQYPELASVRPQHTRSVSALLISPIPVDNQVRNLLLFI